MSHTFSRQVAKMVDGSYWQLQRPGRSRVWAVLHVKEVLMKVLPRDFTSDELDEGIGMSFHPVNGKSLDYYRHFPHGYDANEHQFSFRTGWGGCGTLHLPRIGDGKARAAGDPYLEQWEFDPYTGEKL